MCCVDHSLEVVKKKDLEYGLTFMIVERTLLNKVSLEDQRTDRQVSLLQHSVVMSTEQEWINWLNPV